MRHVIVVLIGLGLFTVNAAPCAADSIRYSVYDSTPEGLALKTVSGTITFDGTLGFLSTANILDWNLVLQDPLESVTFTKNGTVHPAGLALSGSSVFATPDALWVFAEGGGGLGFAGFWCSSGCGANYMWNVGGANGEINHYFLTVVGQPASVLFSQETDVFRLGSRVRAPIPEPSTILMLASATLAGCIRRFSRFRQHRSQNHAGA
jgi:hypothetical protein